MYVLVAHLHANIGVWTAAVQCHRNQSTWPTESPRGKQPSSVPQEPYHRLCWQGRLPGIRQAGASVCPWCKNQPVPYRPQDLSWGPIASWTSLIVGEGHHAWHAGLLRVGVKWYPERSGHECETTLLVCLLYEANMSPLEGVSWSIHAQPCTYCITWLEVSRWAPRLLLAWGLLPRVWCGSWGLASWSSLWVCHWLGVCRNTHSTWPLRRGAPVNGVIVATMMQIWDLKVSTYPTKQLLEIAFKWCLLAMTIHYNHTDMLELGPAHGQPILSLGLAAHDLTKVVLHRHSVQQAISATPTMWAMAARSQYMYRAFTRSRFSADWAMRHV